MVLSCNLGAREVQVVIYHLQGGVAENLPEREGIATIENVIYGESMPAQVRMQSSNALTFSQPGEHELYGI